MGVTVASRYTLYYTCRESQTKHYQVKLPARERHFECDTMNVFRIRGMGLPTLHAVAQTVSENSNCE